MEVQDYYYSLSIIIIIIYCLSFIIYCYYYYFFIIIRCRIASLKDGLRQQIKVKLRFNLIQIKLFERHNIYLQFTTNSNSRQNHLSSKVSKMEKDDVVVWKVQQTTLPNFWQIIRWLSWKLTNRFAFWISICQLTSILYKYIFWISICQYTSTKDKFPQFTSQTWLGNLNTAAV